MLRCIYRTSGGSSRSIRKMKLGLCSWAWCVHWLFFDHFFLLAYILYTPRRSNQTTLQHKSLPMAQSRSPIHLPNIQENRSTTYSAQSRNKLRYSHISSWKLAGARNSWARCVFGFASILSHSYSTFVPFVSIFLITSPFPTGRQNTRSILRLGALGRRGDLCEFRSSACLGREYLLDIAALHAPTVLSLLSGILLVCLFFPIFPQFSCTMYDLSFSPNQSLIILSLPQWNATSGELELPSLKLDHIDSCQRRNWRITVARIRTV